VADSPAIVLPRTRANLIPAVMADQQRHLLPGERSRDILCTKARNKFPENNIMIHPLHCAMHAVITATVYPEDSNKNAESVACCLVDKLATHAATKGGGGYLVIHKGGATNMKRL
jgi:hypothetical protein